MNNLALCFSHVVLLVCGQMMFKLGAHGKEISSLHDICKLIFSPFILTAIFLYAIASILWVYILTKVQISYAYPIQAFAFPVVVIISSFFFQEAIPVNRWVGVAVMMLGVFLITK